jgi:hypothetical protein
MIKLNISNDNKPFTLILKNFIFCFFIFPLTLFSCDCLQIVQGQVLNKTNNIKIDNVIITSNKSIDSVGFVKTNSDGYFSYFGKTPGIFGCPRIILKFEKDGYKSFEKSFKSCCTDSITIYLEPIKN